MRQDIEFISGGLPIRGWLEWPDPGAGAPPVVVAAHGFGGVKEWLAPQSAAMAAAGFAVLVFDHPYFGTSGGEPRQHIDPAAQVRAYRDAVTFARGRAGVDPDRIALWGTSLAGGLVLVAGAVDDRVCAVVAQIPMVDPAATLHRMLPETAVGQLVGRVREDRENRGPAREYAMLPITGTGPGVALPDAETAAFAATRPAVPTYRNEITLASIDLLLEFAPAAFIERIAPRPLLMTIADHDTLCPTDLALAAYARAREPKYLQLVHGGHHSVYGDAFAAATSRQIDFLTSYLDPKASLVP